MQVHVLKGVSLDVQRGEMVAIMGPSGGGKTTLLNCLSGLDDVDADVITIAGSDLSRMRDTEKTRFRATRMGYIFQSFNLLPVLTALENVEMPLLISGFPEKESREKALDTLASAGPVPVGFYVAPDTLGREVIATQFFFKVGNGVNGGAEAIEAAFFQNGVETLDVQESITEAQASQKALFNLLIGFMALGLFVGIAALGVISARAVVERRHAIGVLRAIGFTRPMVQVSFLAESSFISVLGIGLGLVLGLVSSVNLIDEMRVDEPEVEFVIPWVKVLLIAAAAYGFSLLTTFLPARQAADVAPAEALRYE